MPKFFEIYGKSLDKVLSLADRSKLSDTCPFLGTRCDGGGNRHQTKLNSNQLKLIESCFANIPDKIIPGVCAIDYGNERWIVCPRRLFGFVSNNTNPLEMELHTHEREALIAMGAPKGVPLGIWAEVYLKYTSRIDSEHDADAVINYHFDYLVAPVKTDIPMEDVINVQEDKGLANAVLSSGKTRKRRPKSQGTVLIPFYPDIQHPLILEVMTASLLNAPCDEGSGLTA